MNTDIVLILAVIGAILSAVCWFCTSTAHKHFPKPIERRLRPRNRTGDVRILR